MSESKELKLVKSTDKTPRVMRRLDMKEAHQLVVLLLEDFTEKRMSYKHYAEYASEKLGFPVVESHVQSRVVEFGIPHGDKPTPPDPTEYTAMLLKHDIQLIELTERLNKLEVWINQHFPTVSGRKAIAS